MNNKQGFIPLALLIAILIAVAGGGVYYFVKQNQSIAPDLNQQTTSLPQQTQSSVPEDWKTYRNEKYGFEFRYPGGLSVNFNEGDDLIYISGLSNVALPSLKIEKNSQGITLQDEIDERSNYKFTDGSGKITIGGKNAFWFTTTEMGAYVAVIVTQDYIYRFNNFGLWRTDNIIDTFKFTK